MAQPSFFNSPPALKSTQCPSSINADVSTLEDKLKRQAYSKGVRVAEYFGDFDPLRSGSITRDQFRRSMDHHLGFSLSDKEYDLLTSKYESHSDTDRVNYRKFIDKLEKEFDSRNFSKGHLRKVEQSQESNRSMDITQFDDRTRRLIKMCAQYYKNRGIRVKTCYQDFDRHNMGYITYSQFHRSFPGPPEIKEAEISLIAQYYLEPSSGLYNYLKFNSDIEVFWQTEDQIKKIEAVNPDFTQRGKVKSLEEIIHLIKVVVYKNGIRTNEFFCDHDKLRTGIITENQFICGLLLCLGQHLQLNRDDIQKVVKHYQLPDGRIKYKDFCHLMENAYTASNLEQNPDQVIERPLRGQLHKELRVLQHEEEMQLEEVISRLQEQVKKRRIMLHPFFKDFDRSDGYTRGVTTSQFARVLDFVGLSVTPGEFKLIMKKFQDPNGGDINYPAFIQAIDHEFTGHVIEEEEESSRQNKENPSLPAAGAVLSVDEEGLIVSIQNHVAMNRVRTCEYFQDFDPLRSGSISSARFRQGLSSMGFPNLSTAQFKTLCRRYEHPKHHDGIEWKLFVQEIDEAFKKWPETSRPDSTTFHVQKVVLHEADRLTEVLQRLTQRVQQRRLLVKPCFQDFDRHNMGYITKPQFRQCLQYLAFPISEEEMLLIESSFSTEKGFNYLKFINHIQPAIPLERKYEKRLETLADDKLRIEKLSMRIEADEQLADLVMNKIKTKVSKERIRVLEFMVDYDKLRSGCIHVQSFVRALDLCGFKLNAEEIKALIDKYRSNKDSNFVNYTWFSDEVESIFTMKGLEKMPTVQVEQFIPPEEVDLNELSPEQEQILTKCIHRIAERVRERRIQLFPLFEDYDHVHIGSVTASQFRRVLNELDLSGLLSDLEFSIVFTKFGVQVGGRKDVYYIAFCGIVEEYAQNRWNDPELKL